jgi:hypothetical protein
MQIRSFTISRGLIRSLSIISLTAVALAYSMSHTMLPVPAVDISTSTAKGQQTAVLWRVFLGNGSSFEHLKVSLMSSLAFPAAVRRQRTTRWSVPAKRDMLNQ